MFPWRTAYIRRRGHTVRFVTASDMLAELAGQDSSAGLSRRMRRYTVPHLLCVDEVGACTSVLVFDGVDPSLSAAISLVLRLLGKDPDPAKSREHVRLRCSPSAGSRTVKPRSSARCSTRC